MLTDIVEPSTYKSPLILTLPVLTPTPAGSIKISFGPVIVLLVILIPTSFAPVDNLEKVAIPVLFTLELPNAVVIPVNWEPSPLKLLAVTIPEATTVSNTEWPTTSNSDVVVLNFKFALSSTAPEPPAITTRPDVRSDTINDAADKSVPLNNKFPLSSNSPPVPAITTRPDVKSSTLNVFAWPPALISSKPSVVVTSNVVFPSTSKLPVTFKLDEISTLPLKTSNPLRMIAA